MLLSIEDYDIFTLVSRVNKWVTTLHKSSQSCHSQSQSTHNRKEDSDDEPKDIEESNVSVEKGKVVLKQKDIHKLPLTKQRNASSIEANVGNTKSSSYGDQSHSFQKDNSDKLKAKAYDTLMKSNKEVYKSSDRFQQVAYSGGKNAGQNGYNTLPKKMTYSDFVDTKPKTSTSIMDTSITLVSGDGTILDMNVPNEKNTMFWCFYNLLYGTTPKAYEFLDNTCKTEQETKFLLVDVVRSNKESVKSLKISKSSIEENIVHDEFMNIRSVIALVHSMKCMNLLYIHGRAYHEIILDDDLPFHIIKRHPDKEKYGYAANIQVSIVNTIRNSLWHMENLDKPLRCISYYKADDLRYICTQLQLTFTNNERCTKPVMYEKIVKYLSAT